MREHLVSRCAFPVAFTQQWDAVQSLQDAFPRAGLAHHSFLFYANLFHKTVNGLHRYPVQPHIEALYNLLGARRGVPGEVLQPDLRVMVRNVDCIARIRPTIDPRLCFWKLHRILDDS